MKYQPHPNPTTVYCDDCGADITLHAQYIYQKRILCGDCNEQTDEKTED